MKNLNRAAGALFIGAASLALASSANAAEGGTKPWSVSASLRGFYDDNINTAPSGTPAKIDSFGFDISPSLSWGQTIDNTSYEIGYTYTGRWFEARDDHEWDHSHKAHLALNHEFSERASVSLSDTFVSSQEPDQSDVLTGTVFRARGDNINNSANISGTVGLSEQWDLTLSYRNNYYNYKDPAFENTLDRIEHLPSLDLSYRLTPRTSVGVGYQFGIIDYKFADRDYDSHTVYGSVRHAFSPNFSGALSVGAQVQDYDRAGSDSQTSPFVDGKLTYAYTAASDISLNVKHQVNATDVFIDPATGTLVLATNQESTLFQVRWNHALTAKINVRAVGLFQHSQFNGGISDATEDFWSFGGEIAYGLTPHVELTAAYYYDTLTSSLEDSAGNALNRGFDRNRVFLGVRASF